MKKLDLIPIIYERGQTERVTVTDQSNQERAHAKTKKSYLANGKNRRATLEPKSIVLLV